jgi:uncharacterized OB-fold protein
MARVVPGDLPVRFRYTPGVGGTAFFEALRDRGALLGSRCPSCGITYLPARMFCERDFSELAADTECGPGGTLESFTVAHVGIDDEPLAQQVTWATVKLDGADTVMVHRLIDTPKPEVGLRVRAVVREHRTASIDDLEGFAPED